MKPTIDAASLAEIADEEFDRLYSEAEQALNRLVRLWDRLHGRGGGPAPAQEALGAMWDEWKEAAGRVRAEEANAEAGA